MLLLRQYGSMNAVDKNLDADPGQNHQFLQAAEKLVRLKEANPKIRLSAATPLRETVLVSEEEKVGLKAPKRAFLELSQYEKRYGPAPAGKVKTITWKGQSISGVDIVREEDASCSFPQNRFPRFPFCTGD